MKWFPVETIGGDGNLLRILPRTPADCLVLGTMFSVQLSIIVINKWPIMRVCTHIIKQVQDYNLLNRRLSLIVCVQKPTVFARKRGDEAGRGYLGGLSMKPDLYVVLMRPASISSFQ